MPYIKDARRELFDYSLAELTRALEANEATEGDYNYVLTSILLSYHPKTYAEINGLIGILECAKLEMYRRLAAPHEEKAISRNGDLPFYARVAGGRKRRQPR